MAILSEREARQITDNVLARSDGEAAWISLSSTEGGNTRFANNGVTTAGDISDVEVEVIVAYGSRMGSATTNGIDDESLAEVARRAEEAARRSPEDPEFVGPLEPTEYQATLAFFESTAGYGPAERASAAVAAITESVGLDTRIAGFLESYARSLAIANSEGLFAYHRETDLEYTNTVRTPDGRGSGWAGVQLRDADELDAAWAARVAAEKAVAVREMRPLDPGDYPVVFEPAAVAVMAGALVGQMDARRAMEGRSFLSAPGGETRLGETLLSPMVTIATDPAHSQVPGRPWSSEQLPTGPTVWIEEGVVNAMRYSRYWAGEQGVDSVPFPTNTVISGGSGSFEDLIRSTDRAVLVTRLWYVRSLNPRDLTLTGLTRDGTFWIEDGRIAHAVNNFRWNDSPVRFFAGVEAMTESVRGPDESWVIDPAWVPAIRSSRFHFASISQAI